MRPVHRAGDNYRGIVLMVAAVTCFILNDTFVKLAGADMPIPQIIVLRSLIALPLVVLFAWRQGVLRSIWGFRDRFLLWRTFGEIGGTVTYLTALARLDIANITAIAQTNSLAVTAGAALFLGEKVGIRRWSAIVIGLFAVLLVIRPGMEGFNAWSLLALTSVGFVVVRDLSSRAMPLSVHPLTVTIFSLIVLIPVGLVMTLFEPWQAIGHRSLLYCLGSAVSLSIAYVLITQAMRAGEISAVAPFRYTFLLWAIVIQIVVFSIWPDALTLIGSAILVATGIYTVYRERIVKGREAADLNAIRTTVPPPQ